uniref:Activator of Hsp90 ATPase AHSA1-like N-terminal domain-containing protein n=1 Tax=Arion vulgaris TaxID=1028688 RepID=A0A0B6XYD5_9EUPU
MAKWGEGDPRWIVEDRPDATNVNNWHWVEKNATSWSRDRLSELLKYLKVDNEKGTCEITDITHIEGEASANNRKAKLIFFYEFEIKGDWSGLLKDDDKSYTGKFVIPNLSEENDPDEIDVNVTTDVSCNESQVLKDIFRIEGTKLIRAQLAKYIAELKSEYGQNIILPTKNNQTPVQTSNFSSKENIPKQELNKFITTEIPQSTDVGVRIPTRTLTMTETFNCQASDLYRALTFKPMVEAYMGSNIIFEPIKGERFSLAGGNITGEFVELVPDQKLLKRWRVKSWPAEHYSEVTIELVDKEGTTVLNLKQTEYQL